MKKFWLIIKEYLLILKSKWKVLTFLLLILLAYVSIFWFWLTDIPSCMYKQFLGIPCPGCGITRAYASLAKFDFVNAFYYHPLFWFFPIIFFVILFRERPNIYKIYTSKIFWIISAILIVTVYILRMVYIYPKEPMDPYFNNILRRLK